MGKTIKTERTFELEKEVKELRDIIKSLERQLKKRETDEKRIDRKDKKKKEREILKEEKQKCPTNLCGGDLTLVDLGAKTFESCTKKCGYRKTL